MEKMTKKVSPASEQAVAAATRRCVSADERALAAEVVEAMHDPRLGLGRSVCLRDVVAALRSADGRKWIQTDDPASFLEYLFTEDNSPEQKIKNLQTRIRAASNVLDAEIKLYQRRQPLLLQDSGLVGMREEIDRIYKMLGTIRTVLKED